jgi:hypothetical protein
MTTREQQKDYQKEEKNLGTQYKNQVKKLSAKGLRISDTGICSILKVT